MKDNQNKNDLLESVMKNKRQEEEKEVKVTSEMRKQCISKKSINTLNEILKSYG